MMTSLKWYKMSLHVSRKWYGFTLRFVNFRVISVITAQSLLTSVFPKLEHTLGNKLEVNRVISF